MNKSRLRFNPNSLVGLFAHPAIASPRAIRQTLPCADATNPPSARSPLCRDDSVTAPTTLPETFHNPQAVMWRVEAFHEWVVILLTRRCTLRCPHCFLRPIDQPGDEIDPELLDTILDQLGKAPRVRGICFSGGEPFLVHRALIRATNRAAELGKVCFILTNAGWATSARAARSALRPMRKARPSLFLSIDPFHQAHIPLANVENAVVAALELGCSARLFAAYTRRQADSGETEWPPAAELAARYGIVLEAFPISPLGLAREHPNLIVPGDADLPCGMLTKPVIRYDGGLIACCATPDWVGPGHPLFGGRIPQRSFPEYSDHAERNLFLQALRFHGPLWLLRLIDSPISDSLEHGHACEACLQLCRSADTVRQITERLREIPGIQESLAHLQRRVGDSPHPPEGRQFEAEPPGALLGSVSVVGRRDTRGGFGSNSRSPFAESAVILLTQSRETQGSDNSTESGEEQTQRMSAADLRRALSDLARNGERRRVCFSGGEPFVSPSLVRKGLQLARKHGLQTAVVTTASWAGSPRRTGRILQGLAGLLDELYVRVDLFHQERIPLAWVRHVLSAARKAGISATLLNVLTPLELEAGAEASVDALLLAEEFGIPVFSYPAVAAPA